MSRAGRLTKSSKPSKHGARSVLDNRHPLREKADAMRLWGVLVVSLLIPATPASVAPGAGDPDDPLDAVATALDQGRHWHATRLIAELDANRRRSPEAMLLAARADAGRGAWDAVARQLEDAPWLDSLAGGAGRALLARAWLETGRDEHAVQHYRALLAYSIERVPRALAEIGLGRALARLGDPDAAAAYDRAAQTVPELAPWTSIRAAEVLAATGDTAAVGRLVARAAGAPSHRRILAEALAYQRAGDHPTALRLLLDAADSRDNRSHAAELRARVASILLAEGDTAAARGALRTAVRVQPSKAREAAALMAGLPGLDADDHLGLAVAFERSGEPARAARHYREYLGQQSLSTSRRQRLQMKIGQLLYQAGAYAEAIEQLELLLASEPARAIRPQAEYYLARATYRRGWRREGRARLRELADRYPGSDSALRALSLLGDLYEGAGNVARARAIYEEITQRYAGSRAASSAQFRLGILSFLNGEYAGARQHFDGLRRRFSVGTHQHLRATYWAARARRAEGKPAQAAEAERLFRQVHARNPYGYYGLLAAERVGIDPWANLSAGPAPKPIEPATQQQLVLVDLLRQAGFDEEARTVLESVLASRSRRADETLGLSLTLAQRGFGQEAVNLGWKAHAELRGTWSASVLRAVYPLAYREIIDAEARARRLDPYLVAAIARQESAFAPDVTSRAGARGLLQIMPQTGRAWASRLGIRDYSDDLLFHPEFNVHLGAAYFADLQRRYGELQLALVAYNAGPTRARRWRERPAYRLDAELFAERIPFSETRVYVKSVQTWYRIYRQLYGEPGVAVPAE